MSEIQERREKKRVFGGEPLHNYANLYFDAHNPMLSRIRARNSDICILRISPTVLLLPDVIITDRNASCDFVRFFESPEGLQYLDENLIYAKYWLHDDHFEYDEHKSIKCAEVLVPDSVAPHYVFAAYVHDSIARKNLLDKGFEKNVDIRPEIFFEV